MIDRTGVLLDDIIRALDYIVLASLGGIVSVLQQTVIFKKREFNWTYAVSSIFISAFCGVLIFYMCEATNMPKAAAAAAAGIGGNMGSQFFVAVQRVLCNYFKCNGNQNDGD